MPQEMSTAELISRNNAGVLLRKAGDIVPIVRQMLANPAEHAAMRLAAARLAIPDATRRVVDEITRKLDPQPASLNPEPGII